MPTIRYTNNAKLKGKPHFKFLSNLCMRVHADEGDPAPAPAPSNNPNAGGQHIHLEEIIASVRREEKDKLYGTIEQWKKKAQEAQQANNAYIIQIAEYQKRLEEAQKAASADNVEELKARIAELEGQLAEAQKAAPDEAAIRKQVEAEYEVKLYARDVVAQNKDKILSTFVGTVTGKTKEEVDAALASAVEQSTAVRKELGLIDEDGNPIEVGKPKKGAKSDGKQQQRTTPPPVSPSAQEEETFDAEYIRGLDPRSPEYAEFRKKMGLK